jgi:hypothetical protein
MRYIRYGTSKNHHTMNGNKSNTPSTEHKPATHFTPLLARPTFCLNPVFVRVLFLINVISCRVHVNVCEDHDIMNMKILNNTLPRQASYFRLTFSKRALLEILILSIWSKKRPFLGAFAKFGKPTINFVLSTRTSAQPTDPPHEKTRLPMDGFWSNLISQIFSKMCHENSRFI